MRWVVLLLCAAVSPVLWVLLSCRPTARCGDGNRAPSPGREGCDDGNTANGDTCSSTCQSIPYLVDGNLDDFEWLAYPEAHSSAIAADSYGRFLAVWTREYADCLELRGRIFSVNGLPLTSQPDASHAAPCVAGPSDGSFVIATSTVASLEPAIVGLNGTWAVAYSESRFGTVDIATQIVDVQGKLGFRWIANHSEGSPLIPGDQTAPKLVEHEGGYFVAWVDENVGGGASQEIWGRHFSGGTTLENAPAGSPFLIAGDANASMSQVALAGEGSSWAAAWLHDGDTTEIRMRRYEGTTPTDFSPVVIATDATSPELEMHTGGRVFVGYTTTYPFDGHVVLVNAGSTTVQPVRSFDDVADPSETVLSLARRLDYLAVAYVQGSTPRLAALSTNSPFAPLTTPPEWTVISDELAASFDTNVRMEWMPRGLWLGWSGVGAGTLDLGFSVFFVPTEFSQ